ncbi:Mediator of RNA polymerase II transcription subunit 20, partial [Fragariocoptes setiger]
MGVSWVLTYPMPENKSVQQVMDSLYKLMDMLDAKKCGTFSIDCDTYTSGHHIVPSKVMHVLHDSERPATTFALIDGGRHLVADYPNLDILLNMYLNQAYACKKTQRIECKGTRYELSEGDFVIRVGAVTYAQQSSSRGIVIEIEYRPCLIPSMCSKIICDVAEHFMSSSHVQAPSYLNSRMSDIFQPIDYIKQYHELFTGLRKQQSY